MPATAMSQIGASVRLIATFLSRAWPAPTGNQSHRKPFSEFVQFCRVGKAQRAHADPMSVLGSPIGGVIERA